MNKKQYLSYYIRLYLTQYLANEKGCSENTILAYRDALKLLMKYCKNQLKMKIDNLSCDDINAEIIRKFLDYLEKQRNCSSRTRNARLTALKTFFYYLGSEVPECLEISQKISTIPLKRIPHKTVDYLNAAELNTILDDIDINSHNGIRDKTLLLFMYNTGARAQEMVNIKLDDLRLDKAGNVKIIGKGKKERVCPLWPETIKMIKAYITVRRPKEINENYLFLNNRGKQITRFGIRYIVKKYVNIAVKKQPSLAYKKVSPHTFRHTTAMHLLKAGNELNMVRLWLGHANLSTTHMYIEINIDMKKEIINKVFPPQLKQNVKKWMKPDILEWLDTLCSEPKLCEEYKT
ncbi:MAG: site-specific integrase [bacterium]